MARRQIKYAENTKVDTATTQNQIRKLLEQLRAICPPEVTDEN